MTKALRTSVRSGGLRQGGLQAGLGSDNIFATASLDLNFAVNKNLGTLADATTGSNLVDHTRASSGTYVGSDGLIKTAVTNLVLQSEDFSTTWTSNNYTLTTGFIAPDGTTTATKIVRDATNTAASSVSQNVASISSSTDYTYSVYVKAGEYSKVSIREGSSTGAYLSVDLSSATVIDSTGDAEDETIAFVGDGWYRISFKITTGPSQTTYGCRIYALPNSYTTGSPVFNWAGDGTSGIYIWGAQLEQSDTVGEYVKTTSTINSAPRFNHDPTTGESLGLLVEESRTNLLLYSACNSNWITAGFGTATYDLGLSALGIFSGVSVGSLGQVWHTLYRSGISLTASTVYAFTLFYRAGTSGRCRLVFRNNTTATETVINGVAGNLSVGGAFAGSATILSQYLCSDGLTYTITGTYTPNNTSADHWFRIGPDSTTSGETVIALGGQLEAGSFPTSYIPTTTAAVTRAADVASSSGSNFSSWYRQDEGTLFGDAETPFAVTGFPIIADGRVSSTDIVQIGFVTESLSVGYVKAGNADQAVIYNTGLTGVRRRRIAFGMEADNFSVCTNGGALVSDASGNMPTNIADLYIGSRTGLSSLNGTIRRLTYWPTRLPNDTLQTITQ